MAVLPVLVIVIDAVRPLFQALTRYPMLQLDVPDEELLDDGELDEELLDDGELDEELLDDELLWNSARNLFTSAEVHVLVPLVEPDPSTGWGVWSPSNAAHCTGY